MLTLDDKPLTILEIEQAKQQFADRLEFIGLDSASLKKQDIEQLTESLHQVEDCIAHPEMFKILEVKRGDRLHRYISHSGINISFDSIFLPILLERKKLILECLESFQVDNKFRDLHASVKQLADDGSRSKLLAEIDELLNLSQNWREQFHQLAEDQQQLRENAEKNKLAFLDRRHRIWLSFFKKELVATVVGALLLLLIAVVQVVLIFAKLQPSETLNNSFLLILGYFFGQSVQTNLRRDS